MSIKKKKKLSSEEESQLSFINTLDRINYTTEQKDFVDMVDGKSCILASTAGSGKSFCVVQRLKELLKRGVPPNRMIFFSYTKVATEELQKRIGRDDVKITTIHAFALGILAKTGKFKNIITFHDFIKWYKEKYKPGKSASYETKNEFYELIGNLYEESDYISSAISAYKLQTADNIRCQVPLFLNQYRDFLRETRSRDFSDMLIEVRDLLKEDKWLKMFRGQYDYIFVDEYQDTSTIQMQILLSLNAKYYYIIGDRYQAIFGFSGSNCSKIEAMLKSRRETIEKNLTVNFRSDKSIISNSNRFSPLKAISNSKDEGFVRKYIIFQIEAPKDEKNNKKSLDLISVLDSYSEVAILARTNAVIKKLEFELLKRKYPMRYFNYITNNDFIEYKKGNIHVNLQERLNKLKPFFNDSEMEIFTFIETNKMSRKLVTSIHKSKGREFDYCVVVNSIDPELISEVGLDKVLSPKQLSRLTFDLMDEDNVEPRNIHYVAVSRSKHGLFYMLYDF
jgi:superfamily I DNA/RNA helicase